MGFLSGAWNWFSKSDKIIDASISGIDAIFYTEEEKAVAKKELISLKTEQIRALGLGSSASSIARRFVAGVIISLFAIVVVVGLLLVVFRPEDLTNLIDFVKAVQLGACVMTVVGFYFLRQGVSEFVDRYKFGKKS